MKTTSAAPKPCAIVVLGVGLSGTSTVTRGLQALGVELGDQLRPGAGKNPTGFFEDESLLKINPGASEKLSAFGQTASLLSGPNSGRHPLYRPFSRRPKKPSAVDLAHIPCGAISLLALCACCRSGAWCFIP